MSITIIGLLASTIVPALALGSHSSVGVAIVLVITGVLLVLALVRYNRVHKQNKAALTAFAAQNNMAYQPKNGDIDTSGALFSEGHSRRVIDELSGIINELPFRSYAYYYTTGSGKNQQTHDAMVMEITLPRVVPQFVIDSQIESVVPLSFDKSQKIELEGDFHKYFDLYAPDTYGVSALTLLAPDTMEVLMQHAALCDIEIVQNKLFFYWPVPAGNREQYEQLFTTAQAVLGKIGKKLATGNIYGTQSQAQIHAQPNGQGVRLRQSKAGIIMVSVIVLLYIAAQFAGETPFSGIAAVFILLFWGVFFIWIIASGAKQARLKREYLNRYKIT